MKESVLLNEYKAVLTCPHCRKQLELALAKHPHILWMIDQLPDIKKTNQDKYNRWLGFIQGYLWSNNAYTIDELREYNK